MGCRHLMGDGISAEDIFNDSSSGDNTCGDGISGDGISCDCGDSKVRLIRITITLTKYIFRQMSMYKCGRINI